MLPLTAAATTATVAALADDGSSTVKETDTPWLPAALPAATCRRRWSWSRRWRRWATGAEKITTPVAMSVRPVMATVALEAVGTRPHSAKVSDEVSSSSVAGSAKAATSALRMTMAPATACATGVGAAEATSGESC